jgi:hypothetical protein
VRGLFPDKLKLTSRAGVSPPERKQKTAETFIPAVFIKVLKFQETFSKVSWRVLRAEP